MQNIQFVAGLDQNARIVHLFHIDAVQLPVERDQIVGTQLGTFAGSEKEARLIRATLAECLYSGNPQECVATNEFGDTFQYRFEKVNHNSGRILRHEDEVVAIGLACELPGGPELTEREQRIVELIASDMSTSKIASKLRIKTSTVESHRNNIRQKLGVNGTAGIVLCAVRYGLVEL